jgi:hypothetical protein
VRVVWGIRKKEKNRMQGYAITNHFRQLVFGSLGPPKIFMNCISKLPTCGTKEGSNLSMDSYSPLLMRINSTTLPYCIM